MTTCKSKLGNNIVDVYDNSIELSRDASNYDDIKTIYDEQGFLVIRQAIEPELCKLTNEAFDKQIKTSADFFLRQSGSYQPHVITSQGFMKFGVMNIQDFKQKRFTSFKDRFLNVVTDASVQKTINRLNGEPGTLVYTMYFEGNQQTSAHRDSHTIDAQQEGAMVGVWAAAEDIHPEAGRFYLVEGSHKVKNPDLDGIYPGSPEYAEKWHNWIADSGMRVVAPRMYCGDIILFHSLTVHGSLPTIDSSHSRRSLTCHYIPRSQKAVWFRQSDPQKISTIDLLHKNDVPIMLHGNAPIDQFKMWKNKARKYIRPSRAFSVLNPGGRLKDG